MPCHCHIFHSESSRIWSTESNGIWFANDDWLNQASINSNSPNGTHEISTCNSIRCQFNLKPFKMSSPIWKPVSMHTTHNVSAHTEKEIKEENQMHTSRSPSDRDFGRIRSGDLFAWVSEWMTVCACDIATFPVCHFHWLTLIVVRVPPCSTFYSGPFASNSKFRPHTHRHSTAWFSYQADTCIHARECVYVYLSSKKNST